MKKIIVLLLLVYSTCNNAESLDFAINKLISFMERTFPEQIQKANMINKKIRSLSSQWIEEKNELNASAQRYENVKKAAPEKSILDDLDNKRKALEEQILAMNTNIKSHTKNFDISVKKKMKELNQIHRQIVHAKMSMTENKDLKEAHHNFLSELNQLNKIKEKNRQYKVFSARLKKIAAYLRKSLENNKLLIHEAQPLIQAAYKNIFLGQPYENVFFVTKYEDTWILPFLFPDIHELQKVKGK